MFGAFALSPDRKSLEGVKDEEVHRKAKEALGQLGTYLLSTIDRSEKNWERVHYEVGQQAVERDAKERAFQKMKEVAEREERLTNDLSSRDEELRGQKAQMAEVENALETEKASSASLRMEVDRLRQGSHLKWADE